MHFFFGSKNDKKLSAIGILFLFIIVR